MSNGTNINATVVKRIKHNADGARRCTSRFGQAGIDAGSTPQICGAGYSNIFAATRVGILLLEFIFRVGTFGIGINQLCHRLYGWYGNIT